METSEYIEYCEEELKIEIKPEDNDLLLSESRKYYEYFEEDVKEEIDDEKNLDSCLLKHMCDICSKCYVFKSSLKIHIQSVHQKVKYPCNHCRKQFTVKGM